MAALEACEPITERFRFHAVVRDEDRRHAVSIDDLANEATQRPAGVLVERGEGFVEQEKPRRGRECASEGNPLTLAAGKRRRAPFCEVDDVEILEPGFRPITLPEGARKPERDVSRDVEKWEEGWLLRHVTHLTEMSGDVHPGRRIEERPARNVNLTGDAVDEPRERAQRERLACARRPEENKHPRVERQLHLEVKPCLRGPHREREPCFHKRGLSGRHGAITRGVSRLATSTTTSEERERTPT